MKPPPSASVLGAPPRVVPRWRRWAVRLGVGLLLLAIIAWGGLTWLAFNPFEGRVERLDRVVPPSVAVALRGSFAELQATDFLRHRVLGHPAAEQVVLEWDLDRYLEQLEDNERRMNAELPAFLRGVTLRGDVFGEETVVFGTPDLVDPARSRMALATRISDRARAGLAVLKHDWARRRVEAETGLVVRRRPSDLYEIDGAALFADPADAVPAWAARVRDVLIVGNDKDLVTEAARLARTGGQGSLPDRPDAGRVFSEDLADVPLRAFADVEALASAAERAWDATPRDPLDDPDAERAIGPPTPGEWLRSLDGIEGFLGFLVDPDALATVAATATFPDADSAVLAFDGVRHGGVVPSTVDALVDAPPREGADALAEAALLAPAGSAFVVARLDLPVGEMIRLLYGRASAAVRQQIEEQLTAERTSLDAIADDADAVFLPGVSIVVERLPECDDLGLDSMDAVDGRFVLPVPGVLLALRRKGHLQRGDAETYVRRIQGHFEARSKGELEDLPHPGMTGFRMTPKFLGAELELVRPAVAFDGDLTLIASNEGLLRRALEARDGGRPAVRDIDGFADGAARAGAGQMHAFLDGEPFLRHLADRRREVATAAVDIDWGAWRRRTHTEIVLAMMDRRQEIVQQEVIQAIDAAQEQRQREQRDVDFPRAVQDYLEGLDAWRVFRSGALGLDWDSAAARLRFVIRTDR